jgi:biotin synthase
MASAVSNVTDICWIELAQSIIDGHELTAEQALAVLNTSDFQIPQLLDAAWRVRSHHFGNAVQLYYLKNAKSGLCPEDCGYCSQNAKSTAEIDKYPMLSEDEIVAGAKQAFDAQARTYCIVTSGRGPSNKDVDHVASAVKRIKAEYGLHICCCLGLLDDEQAVELQAAGVDRINHNLNTSRKFYESICSTHTFDDRIDTLKSVRAAGMELCCGVIAGMGEEHQDLVDVALELQGLRVESIPVNFLNSIEGTQLESVRTLDPRFCLKTLCMFRFANPSTEIRIAGGREVNLRSMQAMSLYPANSLFVSDYLTTAGQAAEADFQMIEDLGFEIVTGDAESHALWQQRRKTDNPPNAENSSCESESTCGSGSGSFSC